MGKNIEELDGVLADGAVPTGGGDFEAWWERKRLAAEELAAADVEGLGLRGTDGRLEDYLLEVRGRPEGHNLYEVLAAGRFVRLLEGYRWDAATVRRFMTRETLRNLSIRIFSPVFCPHLREGGRRRTGAVRRGGQESKKIADLRKSRLASS